MFAMELSLAEIRNFMLNNGCKVTNHALVKHFKEILTNPDTQSESKDEFLSQNPRAKFSSGE